MGAIEREKKTVAAMFRLYCAERHGTESALCATCAELLDYSHRRLDRCPYSDAKPACNQCPIHCYQPAKREAMKDVMRTAGPRMLFRHPWLALEHLWKARTRSAPLRLKQPRA